VEAIDLKRIAIIAAAWVLVFISAPAPGAPSPPAEYPIELQRARENLKLSEQTRDRIAEEVAALKASGRASPEVVAAYETYLARVQELVVEHQRLAAQMEAAYSAHQARSQTAGAPAAPGEPLPPPASSEEPADRLKTLDREFNESLSAFDEMLLKELRLIQAASAKRMKGLAEAAAEAGRRAEEKEGEAGTAEKGGGAEKSGAGTEQTQTSDGRGKSGDPAGAGQAAGGWGSGGTGSPPGIYTPSPDDDIVARQLREAAEKETDPELKAKLWKEYEEYKKSRARP
jgi:hypothetical protein